MTRAAVLSSFRLFAGLCWLISLAIRPAAAHADDFPPDSSLTMYRRVVTLTGIDSQTVYPLPDQFVVYHTDRIEAAGRMLVRDVDYRIDYETGLLTLVQPVPSGTPLLIRYERFPLQFQRQYTHRQLVIQHVLADSLPGSPAPIRAASSRSDGRSAPFGGFPSTLAAGGSKTFSITAGSNRDASLEQSLRIQISGKATRDVEVVAILSDQSSPIQPEGNTQTLQELDKVLVQVKTPHVTTTMGDYHVTLDKTTFARYDRKLKGAQGEVQFPNGSLTVAAAVSEGKFTTNTFQGTEGNQGPYQLTGDNGMQTIIVIAGTEKVWIDGVRMIRGADNDYTIDYSSAQITFTRRRLITSESRIVIDFEYTDQQFRRNLYAGRGEFTVGQNMTIGTTLIREGDDRDSPVAVTLSPDDIAALKKVNGDTGQAQISGAKFVGDGKGSYTLQHDPIHGTDFFQYVGPTSGMYTVSFSQVDPGKGDYIPQSGGGFQYLGSGLGNYVPQVFLPLPTSQSLIGFDLSATPTPNLRVKSEVAVSGRNLNTFADGHSDHTQGGGAFVLSTSLSPQSIRLGDRSLGQFELTGTYRAVQNAFRPIGRIDDAEYNRRYDQGQAEPWRGNAMELSAMHRMGNAISIGGGFGRLTRPDGFASRRQEVTLSATPRSLPSVMYRYEVIHSNSISIPSAGLAGQSPSVPLAGRWVRQKATSEYTVWRLRPHIGFEDERRQQAADGRLDGGRNFSEVTAGLETARFKRLVIASDLSYRTDDVVGLTAGGSKDWLRESVSQTLRHRVSIRDWRTLTVSAQVIQREKTFRQAAGRSNQESLIDARMGLAPWRRALLADAHYEITNTQSAQTFRRYVRVGRGRGSFRLDQDSGEFVPDPDGEYVVRFEQVSGFVPVTGVKASVRLQASPYKRLASTPAWLKTVLRNFTTDTFFAVEERTKEQNKQSIYLLRLSKFQQDSTTVAGNLTVRHDVFLFPQRRNLSVRLRYQRISDMNNQYITGGERRFREEQSVRIRMPVTQRTTLEVQLAHETKRRKDAGQERFVIRSNSGDVSLAHRPIPQLELLVQVTAGRDDDTLNDIQAVVVGIAPRITYSFRGRGRARFDLDWASVRSTPFNALLPFEMARGRRTGGSLRWQGGIDYQVSRYVSVLMNYDGRLDPGRPVIHTARAEMRAFF